ncbi:DUF6344 domain-containing protein [Streptomyces sp. NPDC090025]|uniref:DUF6344 domain-containing protein n=1 Tax=Streptomyces sp. NPDC090025 TaxID=3365922 RepID=UPI0038331716
MATAKVKQFWTAFVSVFFALFAALGLAAPAATAAAQPALAQGDEPRAAARAERPEVSLPAQRTAHPTWHTARGRALPPTIKQRIGAEAHGSSPSVRHLRDDALDGLDADDALAGAGELADAALTGADRVA